MDLPVHHAKPHTISKMLLCNTLVFDSENWHTSWFWHVVLMGCFIHCACLINPLWTFGMDIWYGHILVDTTEKLPSDILLPLMFVKLLFPQHYSLTLSLPCFSVQIKHKICKNMNYVQQQCEHYH